ncbi:hypothetical protein R3P38DRAFT_2866262 [Favolaschia claudopus]|uniref:Uncharacterized protein n=1 Tax=Favolaschia claudopus TaxID=2862362 RepID=A0AAW0DGW6_9AGAR
MNIKSSNEQRRKFTKPPVNAPMLDSANPRHYNAADRLACERHATALRDFSTGNGQHPGNPPRGYHTWFLAQNPFAPKPEDYPPTFISPSGIPAPVTDVHISTAALSVMLDSNTRFAEGLMRHVAASANQPAPYVGYTAAPRRGYVAHPRRGNTRNFRGAGRGGKNFRGKGNNRKGRNLIDRVERGARAGTSRGSHHPRNNNPAPEQNLDTQSVIAVDGSQVDEEEQRDELDEFLEEGEYEPEEDNGYNMDTANGSST